MLSQNKPSAAPKDGTKMDKATQELFDIFITNGMEIIYDEETAKSMLPRLGSNPDPTKAMAELLVDIILRLIISAKENGKVIPPEVVFHGGNFLFGELLKVLEAAGMKALTEQQKVAVWQMASSLYIDKAVATGLMTKQELIALSDEVKRTDTGQKVMDAADDPAAAMEGLERPAMEEVSTEVPVDPNAIAVPSQGGM